MENRLDLHCVTRTRLCARNVETVNKTKKYREVCARRIAHEQSAWSCLELTLFHASDTGLHFI